ncbi:hypothetical protein [Burkholderia cepacia]|uniref:hypothetical protein n=1 Tax=Burkholderia cepacia TaxID=292 RepID=UPI001F34E081|nr:hypothetical protein [Burkholderia cepacia]UIY58107.1 hypothetical protein LZ568_07790 [Burkholderia cepacia]
MTFKYINCPESPLHGLRVEIVDSIGYDVRTDEMSEEFCVVKTADNEWNDPGRGDRFSIKRSVCVDERPEIDRFHAYDLESAREDVSEAYAEMLKYATPEAIRYAEARQSWLWSKDRLMEMCREYAERSDV